MMEFGDCAEEREVSGEIAELVELLRVSECVFAVVELIGVGDFELLEVVSESEL